MTAQLYSDGRMRSAGYHRAEWQVWAEIDLMFAEHPEEERLAEKWENEELRAQVVLKAKAVGAFDRAVW